MNNIKSFIGWFLYSLYLYFAYHLLITPAILDLSLLGIAIVVPVLLFMVWTIPSDARRKVIVFSLLLLLADKAFFNLVNSTGIEGLYTSGLLIIAVILALGKWYGKLSSPALIVLVIAGLLTVPFMPRDEVKMLNHFTKKWQSERLYAGEVFDYFPLTMIDVDQDGTKEIVTLGNAEEREKELAQEELEQAEKEDQPLTIEDYLLSPEKLYLYVFKWDGKQMVRMEPEQYDAEQVWAQLPKDYLGFPYYVKDEQNQLVPITERQELAEGMLQFGTAPFRAMELNVSNLAAQLELSNGAMDTARTLTHGGKLHDIEIKNGIVSGYYGETAFRHPTEASQIIDGIQLPDGKTGLILLGNDLEILTFDEQQGTSNVALTHQLTRSMLKNIATTEFEVADIDFDGTDELLVSSSYSRILKPLANGEWEILWTATDSSFRFEDLAALGSSQESELITLDKSTLASHALRYLTGYTYTGEGLKRNWKSFISMINVHASDIDQDEENELVASIYRSHQIYVLERHNLPVTGILLGCTILLAGYGIVRRVRHAR